PDIPGVHIESWDCRHLASNHMQSLASVFNSGYRNGDPAYLDEQVERHDYVVIATCEHEPAGFMFGTFRLRELPGFGETFLTIGGLGCVAPAFQRRGLFSAMRNCPDVARFAPAGPLPSSFLTAGRFAHPAGFRPFAKAPGVVPVPGQTPSPLQQEVGHVVAGA